MGSRDGPEQEAARQSPIGRRRRLLPSGGAVPGSVGATVLRGDVTAWGTAGMVMDRLKTACGRPLGWVSGAAIAAMVSSPAWAEELLGQPTPGAIDLQRAASPLKHEVIFFHNIILLPIITAICLFVLGLLIFVMVRFNHKTNPTPARWSHNTPIEIVWTVLPVLILMFIAIFSFRLLYAYHDMPKPDLTVKVTGNQWYWSYEYPDNGDYSFDSHLLPEDKARAAGVPYKLAVDKHI